MLTVVTGRAGTGKSEYILNEAKRLALAGERVVLLVPEQSSFLYEKKLTLRLADGSAGLVEVKSFRKTASDLFKELGGGAKRRIDEETRAALVRRAALSCGSEAALLKRHIGELGYCASIASAINELKNAAVTPERLLAVSENASTGQSRVKLRELSALFARYEAIISGNSLDPADELCAAAALARKSGIFRDKTVLIDGFSGFTEPQREIVAAALALAKDVVAAFCCDEGESEAFLAAKNTVWRLCSLAKDFDIEVKRVRLAENRRFKNKGLSALESYACENGDDGERAGVYRFSASDRYGEAAAAASEIKKLTSERGYRYSDICVIARDLESYDIPVRRTFAAYGIPLFCDSAKSPLHSPVAVFIKNALRLADTVDGDALLALAKTGLTKLGGDEVLLLSSYAFVWDIRDERWLFPFENNPDGFADSFTPEQTARLEATENARAFLAGEVSRFQRACEGKNGEGICGEVMELLSRCGGIVRLSEDGGFDYELADASFAALERLYSAAGEDVLTGGELERLFALLAAGTKALEIPPALDEVQFGCADRIRTDNPRAAFILGLNEGEFPKETFEAGILSFEERDLINESGASLALSFDSCIEMEQLYLYRALSCARERAYLFHSKTGKNGAALFETPFIERFCAAAPCEEPEFLGDFLPYVRNAKTAQRELGALLSSRDARASALDLDELADAKRRIESAALAPEYRVSDAGLMKKLLTDEYSVSPSKAETFANCAFSYYLKYILKIRPVQKASLSPIEAGSFVHSVLENVMKKTNGQLTGLPGEKLDALCEDASQAFVEARMGDAAGLPRMRYLAKRLSTQTKRLVSRLQKEQEQTEFRTEAVELEIARNTEFPPIRLETDEGASVYVEGKIDRVDAVTLNGKRYIRVVDYKTGEKKFSLADVAYGINMQMLIYIFSLCRGGKYVGSVPAGVLYMPADPAAPDESLAPESVYKMDGLVLDDPQIIEAMESGGRGVFVPVKLDGDKQPAKSEKLASLEMFGKIERHIEGTLTEMANDLYAGRIPARPAVDGKGRGPCDYCEYAAVCRKDRIDKKTVMSKDRAAKLFGGGDVQLD